MSRRDTLSMTTSSSIPACQVCRAFRWHALVPHPAASGPPFAIVFAAFASESQRRAVLQKARDHLKDVPTGLVLSSDTGRIDLDVGDASATLVFFMAAASAVLQCSWAWDESESIIVRVGAESFQFTVQFKGNHTFNATELAAA